MTKEEREVIEAATQAVRGLWVDGPHSLALDRLHRAVKAMAPLPFTARATLPRAGELLDCARCGGLVAIEEAAKHVRWHESEAN